MPGGKPLLSVETNELRLLMESGYVCLHMGKIETAREIFAGAKLLAPRSEVPLVAIGNTYMIEDNFDQALKMHEEALLLNKKSALAKAHIGEVFLVSRKLVKARAALEEAIKMDQHGKPGAMARALLDLLDAHESATMEGGEG